MVGGVAHLSIYMIRDYDPTVNEPCPHGQHKTECERCGGKAPDTTCPHGVPKAECGRCQEAASL